MITNAILSVFQVVLNIILLPLTVINIGIDFVSSIPVVTQFLQIVAYMLPFSNLLPLIILVIMLLILRVGIALIKFMIEFIPFM